MKGSTLSGEIRQQHCLMDRKALAMHIDDSFNSICNIWQIV